MSMSKTVSLDPLTDTKSIHKWREYTRYTQTMIWAACKGEGRVKMCVIYLNITRHASTYR